MIPGGYNPMSIEQMNEQVKTINRILKHRDITLYYGIVSGEYQIVAGINYKIVIKHYKCKHYYLLEYFVDLNKKVSGSIHKLDEDLNKPSLCIVRWKN